MPSFFKGGHKNISKVLCYMDDLAKHRHKTILFTILPREWTPLWCSGVHTYNRGDSSHKGGQNIDRGLEFLTFMYILNNFLFVQSGLNEHLKLGWVLDFKGLGTFYIQHILYFWKWMRSNSIFPISILMNFLLIQTNIIAQK